VSCILARFLPKPGEDRPDAERWLKPTSPIFRDSQPCAHPVCSPAVRLEVHGGRLAGVTADTTTPFATVEHGAVFETEPVPSNGLSPVWAQSCTIICSDVDTSVLRLLVLDKASPTARGAVSHSKLLTRATRLSGNGLADAPPDGGLMGWQALPLSALRSGYVSVALRDRLGVRVRFATLLLHVSVSEHPVRGLGARCSLLAARCVRSAKLCMCCALCSPLCSPLPVAFLVLLRVVAVTALPRAALLPSPSHPPPCARVSAPPTIHNAYSLRWSSHLSTDPHDNNRHDARLSALSCCRASCGERYPHQSPRERTRLPSRAHRRRRTSDEAAHSQRHLALLDLQRGCVPPRALVCELQSRA
jgi:hypothetical protein